MELCFAKTFSPIIKVIAYGGFYFPSSNVLYPRFPKTVEILTHIMFVSSWLILILETVNQLLSMKSSKAEGMTDLLLILGFGVTSPTYIFLIYARCTIPNMKRIVSIWEKEMANAPYPEDREAEITDTQKYLSKIAKIQIYGLIIPVTLWSARSIVTGEAILPVAYTGDLKASPIFEIVTIFFTCYGYCLSAQWCTTENVKLMFMKCILAELNHLEMAATKILTFTENEKAMEGKKLTERVEVLSSIRKNLRNWIIYHQTVLRFSDEIINFIGPIIFLQEICAITFAFTSTFVVVTGNIPMSNSLTALSYFAFYIYIMYVINSLGDEIRMKSARLMDSFNEEDFYLYTKDIIKNVNIINYTAMHRPINPRAMWYKNLSRKSLAELVGKGYEMLTFMNHLFKRNQI